MRIIIVGCGKIGMSLTEQLDKEGHNITLIDTNNRILNAACTKMDVMGVVGNGAGYSVLKEAGVEEADLVIAATDSDEINLLTCLVAKKTGGCSTIARVRNPVYNAEINIIKEELGLSMTFNPEEWAATEIARLLRFRSAIKIDTFAKGKVEILKFRLTEGNLISGMTVAEAMQKLRSDTLFCAIERGDKVIIPDGQTRFEDHDLISVLASPKNAAAFFKKIKMNTHQVHDAMILGGGKIGFYLAKQLSDMKIPVTIIEKNYDRCMELTDLLPSATIINGDAANEELLLESGAATADSIVALTDMDEENIVLSLFANRISTGKVITKVNRIAFSSVIEDFDLDTIIHPKYIAAEHITQYVRAMQNSLGSNVETMSHIIENKVEALEFLIKENSPVISIPLESLKLKEDILVACINHEGTIITPRGKDVIHSGDSVIVVTTRTGLKDIKDILEN